MAQRRESVPAVHRHQFTAVSISKISVQTVVTSLHLKLLSLFVNFKKFMSRQGVTAWIHLSQVKWTPGSLAWWMLLSANSLGFPTHCLTRREQGSLVPLVLGFLFMPPATSTTRLAWKSQGLPQLLTFCPSRLPPSWQTSPRSQLWPCSAAGFTSLTPGGPVESMSPVHAQSQYKPVQPMWLTTPCFFRFSHRIRCFWQNFPSLLSLPKSPPHLGLWGIFQPIWALWRPHSTLKQLQNRETTSPLSSIRG